MGYIEADHFISELCYNEVTLDIKQNNQFGSHDMLYGKPHDNEAHYNLVEVYMFQAVLSF